MEFKGKTALITGASVGIGRAAALQFAEKGAAVVVADWNQETLAAVEQELLRITPDVLAVRCDVSKQDEVLAAVRAGEERFGKIDILVNNAALWRAYGSFLESSVDEWKQYIDINVMGVVYFSKAVLPGMLERHWGRIINVASVAGVYPKANMVHYSATKAAVIAISSALAKEVTAEGVLVNAVSPGSVSDSGNSDIDHHTPSDLCFMGRTGTDRENANLICFLAGEDASYIAGQNILIDGCRMKM
ncbi:MAG: SDR family oxidoreductase [Oscillospiraceae bacterium]|nr:SDR family oxidoreductase [Oscillospiraceae bacterium]